MHTPPMAAITGFALSSTSLIKVRKFGYAHRLGRTEFSDVCAAGKARSGPDQHDGVDAGIRIGALQMAATKACAQFLTRDC